MVSIYASFRPQIPTSAIAVASVSGGSVSHTISGNLYFQYYNRAGRNLLSAPIPVTINPGEKLQITVPVGAIAEGETVFKVVFSLSTTGNEVDAQDIAAIQVRENSGSVITNFPATVELTADEHFVLSGEVPTFEDLPAASVIGMKRKVTVDNVIYEYGYDARWQPAITGFSAYQADTTVTGGSDLVLTDATDAIAVPDNPLDVESYPLRAWILNGYDSDGLNPLPQGARYTFNFAINDSTTSVDDVPYSNIFANKTYVQILGYVERATGALDVSKAVNKKLWNGTENYIVLPEDLPRGHAALLSISLMVEESDLAGIATANSRITFDIERRSDSIPQLNPLAKMLILLAKAIN